MCLVQNSPSVKDCLSSAAISKNSDTLLMSTAVGEVKKMTLCDSRCEGLVSDVSHRLVSESKQSYVKQEILQHLSHVTVHQLNNNSTL